ncbi:MAG: alpha/beta fold hydrolase [Pseudomonadota bacterium]
MTQTDRSVFYPGGRTGVLLMHGLGGTPIEMRYVARGLARQGYTVYCPTLDGHCGPVEALRNVTWQDWYASVERAHDWMRAHCDTVIAGGLSAGAVLSLRLAAERRDEISGLLLYAPTLKLDGWSIPKRTKLFNLIHTKWCANLFPFEERHPYGIKDKRFREFVVEALNSGDSGQAGVLSTPGGAVLELRWLVNQVRRQLASITQPALLIQSREDDRSSFASNAGVLQRSLGGAVETVVLDDSYHIITIDRQKDLVVDRSAAFVERLLAGVAPEAPVAMPIRERIAQAARAKGSELLNATPPGLSPSPAA